MRELKALCCTEPIKGTTKCPSLLHCIKQQKQKAITHTKETDT